MTGRRVVVVGAGMGGLTGALRAAARGFSVVVLEARRGPGGLASGFEAQGLRFDGGPYILLDRPGLDWAFERVGLSVEGELRLRRVEHVYDVTDATGKTVSFHASLEQTLAGLEASWPGSGARYRRYVERTQNIYATLQPLLFRRRGGPVDLLRSGAWRHAPFLLKNLASILADSGLPVPVTRALAIWTHIAGQRVEDAPSPMSFVPSLIHGVGAYYPEGGLAAVPQALYRQAQARGIAFRFDSRVRAFEQVNGALRSALLDTGERVEADFVLSDAGALTTLIQQAPGTPSRTVRALKALPLQSPGVAAYLATSSKPARGAYLRFLLPGDGSSCRGLVLPSVVDAKLRALPEAPARLLSPMNHDDATARGAEGQEAALRAMLEEPWWRTHLPQARVVASRIPTQWGEQFGLYRDSMNPTMTARFMRAGRVPHRAPGVSNLFLAGSATHPGQWVSFAAISGVLAADMLADVAGAAR